MGTEFLCGDPELRKVDGAIIPRRMPEGETGTSRTAIKHHYNSKAQSGGCEDEDFYALAMAFEIYVPSNLTFADYIAVCQCSRTLADSYDRKDPLRLRSTLAPDVVVDYSLVVPAWGQKAFTADAFVAEWLDAKHLGVKALATQHLLGIPYFKSVTNTQIIVEWQQLASHGRRVQGEDFASPLCKINESSDGRSWMQQTFVKVEGEWRISVIRPEVIYHTGDFIQIGRQDEVVG